MSCNVCKESLDSGCFGVSPKCVCVCVHPWTKGNFHRFNYHSFHHGSTSRGMERTREAPSNEAPHVLLGYHQGRLMTYLHHNCCSSFSTSNLIHGGFTRYFSQKTGFFPQPLLQLSCAASVTAIKGNNHCSNTYNFSDFSPCCSTALPIGKLS